MAEADIVAPQITDSVAQTNVATLGQTPAYALAQSELAFSQSQGVLFANMISDQQQQTAAGAAAIVKCVQELWGGTGSGSLSTFSTNTTNNTEKTHLQTEVPTPQAAPEPEPEPEEDPYNDPFFGELSDAFVGDCCNF